MDAAETWTEDEGALAEEAVLKRIAWRDGVDEWMEWNGRID